MRSKPTGDDDGDIDDRDFGKGLPPPTEQARLEPAPADKREPEPAPAKAPAKAPKPAHSNHPSDLENDRPRGTNMGPHGDGLPF
jgi:hypothetical protein